MTYPLHTSRLTLRPFKAIDLPAFAKLHADAHSMVDYGVTLTEAESMAKLSNYLDTTQRDGIGRLHVSDPDGFVGYVDVMAHDASHPVGAHFEIGWRLLRRAWGKGYASEAASSALKDAFQRLGVDRILAYTAPNNALSRAVMARLHLHRHPELDFDLVDPIVGRWSGQVWVAEAADWAGGME
ncbi:GNAT family N-acetyltransferase [Roseovarius sp. 2305UL8-3]|uniref:GNAT family N-acetyltransferase n=1 Tax=Roseovarius conchicola TaxID=3121636 RepID=UPI003527E8BE